MRKIDIHNLPEFLSIGEVAKLFRVTNQTVKKWSDEGDLPAVRTNSRGDRWYKRETIMEILNREE